MGAASAISWTDDTFNPWIGCARVSPACDGCYAAAMMGGEGRFSRAEWGGPGKGVGTRSRTAPANWRKPRVWNREALAAGVSRFVFCASLADVFDNAVPIQWLADLLILIAETPALTWLLLTKRIGIAEKRAREAMALAGLETWPKNAAIGATVVTQDEANRDVPKLLEVKARLKPAFAFVSMEPLIERVDLTSLDINGEAEMDALAPYLWADEWAQWKGTSDDAWEEFCEWYGLDEAKPLPDGAMHATLDWVIAGGETDQGDHEARPYHPKWFTSLRDQCAAAGVPFHFKQHGEWRRWAPGDGDAPLVHISERDGKTGSQPGQVDGERNIRADTVPMSKVGKAASGRELEGAVHDARPELRSVQT